MNKMAQQPDVSVIVPMYNVEEFLDKCISSIVSQTYDNIEILLIDDGSTDNTRNICFEWKERDRRIKYYYQDNQGLGPARHTGINNAKGKYLAFVDSDDWIAEQFIEKMYLCAQNENADFVICDFYSVYEDDTIRYADVNLGESVGLERSRELSNIKSNCIWKTLTEKRLWEDYHIVMPAIPYEDLASFPLLVIMSRKIAAVREALYYYRCGRPGSIINNSKNYKYFVDAALWLRQKAIKLNVYDHYMMELKNLVSINAEYLLDEGKKHLEEISYIELKQYYAKSFEQIQEWCDILG